VRLTGRRVVLRPLEPADVEPVRAILSEPEVRRWWGEYDTDRVRRDLLDDPEVTSFAIELEHEHELVGLISYYEELEPDYRHAGIDISLATKRHGQGLGSEAIGVLARHLVEDRGHHRLIIDPAADNARAIRSYERAGFRPVGVMREYERGPDGSWHDGLLMDLLARELPPTN
jgi:aminoglycoside 6'-N-acetyltransferase